MPGTHRPLTTPRRMHACLIPQETSPRRQIMGLCSRCFQSKLPCFLHPLPLGSDTHIWFLRAHGYLSYPKEAKKVHGSTIQSTTGRKDKTSLNSRSLRTLLAIVTSTAAGYPLPFAPLTPCMHTHLPLADRNQPQPNLKQCSSTRPPPRWHWHSSASPPPPPPRGRPTRLPRLSGNVHFPDLGKGDHPTISPLTVGGESRPLSLDHRKQSSYT